MTTTDTDTPKAQPLTAEEEIMDLSQIPADAPVMEAWRGFTRRESFAQTKRTLALPEFVDGVLFGIFYFAYVAGATRAAEVAGPRS